MHLRRLWLHAFRSYTEAEIEFAPGLTLIRGANGTGKSNLLEAAGYLATLASFRGAPSEALVQLATAPESPPAGSQSAGQLSAGSPGRPDAPQERAVIRGEVRRGQRDLLIETEIVPGGRNRTMVNKQPLSRRDPDASLQVSVFSPDDLILVKGGPGERRAFLDELLAGLHPRNDAALKELDRILRQRNALLKQAGGRLTPEVGFTLDVWDAKLASTGTAVATLRQALLEELRTFIDEAYGDIADRPAPVAMRYEPTWMVHVDGLGGALRDGRADDMRRGLSLVGPHRDEVELRIEGRLSRSHASQGEQRTLALALRLGGHRLLSGRLGSPPVLLLDDVFSELDPVRSDALIRHLPPGQALLATAGEVPPSAAVEETVRVVRIDGRSRLSTGPGMAVDKAGETVEETASERVG